MMFGSTSATWCNSMSCLSGECSASYSQSQISADGTSIYSLFIYGSGRQYAYFIMFNKSDGKVIGSRYKSNIGCTACYGSAISGDIYIRTCECVSGYLLIYNLATSEFTFKVNIVNDLFLCGVDPKTGRFYINEFKANISYITWVMPQAFNAHPEFNNAVVFSLNILSAGVEDITIENGVILPSTYYVEVSSVLYTNQTFSYTSSIIYTSDIYFQTKAKSFSKLEHRNAHITVDLPCSYSGSTSISYNIKSYKTSVPSWISINSNTGDLTVDAPTVSEDTEYEFYISSAISGVSEPVLTLVKLTLLSCNVLNCQTCTSSSVSICEICNSGYSISYGKCEVITAQSSSPASQTPTSDETIPSNCSLSPKSNLVNTLFIVICSMLGVIAFAVIISKLASCSSMTGFWLLIYQIQLLFILVLTRSYIPNNVQSLITSLNSILNFPDLIPFDKIGFIDNIIQRVYIDFSNSLLCQIGVNSRSIIYNCSAFIILFALLCFVYFCNLFAYCLFFKCNDAGSCSFIKRTFKCITTNILKITTFSLFIKFILIMNLFLLICSCYELFLLNTSSRLRFVSFMSSITVLTTILALDFLTICLSFSSYKVDEKKHNVFGELFVGLKMNYCSKLYSSLALSRKIIFVLSLNVFSFMSSRFEVIILTIIQICYTIYLIIARPYSKCVLNLIDILNEIFIFAFLIYLIFINKSSESSSLKSYILLWSIFINITLISNIIFFDASKKIGGCIIRKLSGSFRVNPEASETLTPIANLQSKSNYFESKRCMTNGYNKSSNLQKTGPFGNEETKNCHQLQRIPKRRSILSQ